MVSDCLKKYKSLVSKGLGLVLNKKIWFSPIKWDILSLWAKMLADKGDLVAEMTLPESTYFVLTRNMF